MKKSAEKCLISHKKENSYRRKGALPLTYPYLFADTQIVAYT